MALSLSLSLSLSSLTSSFSSLSFSPTQNHSLLPRIKLPPKPLRFTLTACLATDSVTATTTDVLSDTSSTPTPTETSAPPPPPPPAAEETDWLDGLTIEKYVKKRLPGGFAAQTHYGTGRRKRAVARVVIQEGTGKVIINYRDAEEYLQGNLYWLRFVKAPLVTLGYEKTYDIFVKAHGGGLSGQAQAITLGVARALLRVSATHRPPLKAEGYLTRDARKVERKKAGLHKARKAPQYSKR